MRKFTRLPAIIVLLVATGFGVAIIIAQKVASANPSGAILKRKEELSKVVADGKADGKIWFEYAELLRQTKEFKDAADAYKRAEAANCPDLHAAQLGRGLALAQAANDDAFFSYLDELVATDAKAVLAILNAPESASKKSNPRYDTTRTTAENQAVD